MTASQATLLPIIGVRLAASTEANALLDHWRHPLGACHRPFGVQHWILETEDHGPVALATSASIVSTYVEGVHRQHLVELARIARAPDHPHSLRVMLRLWRLYLAQRWPYWPVDAAIAYSMPGTPGDLYRFDGWEFVRTVRPSAGGGTWTRPPRVNAIADGRKGLWRYVYRATKGGQ